MATAFEKELAMNNSMNPEPTTKLDADLLPRCVTAMAHVISNAQPTSTVEGNDSHYVVPRDAITKLGELHKEIAQSLWGNTCVRTPASGDAAQQAREIVQKVSDAAIELAFVRHELTTTDYEEEEHADVEEGVEAFKALVEEVKADVLACLTGDDTGCLDPEDVDYDNEMEWTKRRITTALEGARAERGPLKLTKPNGAWIDEVREQVLIQSPCGVSGHFRFQLNGGNCLMCQKAAVAEANAAKSASRSAREAERQRLSAAVKAIPTSEGIKRRGLFSFREDVLSALATEGEGENEDAIAESKV